MTVRVRFMIIQTLSFGFRTRSIHLFDCDPHERPNPSAPSYMPQSILRQGYEPTSVFRRWSFGFIGALMRRGMVILSRVDAEEGESGCAAVRVS